MNPNHYLAVAIGYLYANRPGWPADTGIGKTAVSSSMIDFVAHDLGRRLVETPVGFKWFVPGLIDSSIGFGGEESAGASFLRTDGTVWTTDKDGLILCLLASEILAVTGQTPSERYRELTQRFGEPVYARIDVACSKDDKAKLGKLSASDVTATELAGDPITQRLTEAPGNGAAIGGLKVVTEGGWFAARPVGHRGRLQGLRRELQGARAPDADPGGGARRRRRSAQRLTRGAAVRRSTAWADGGIVRNDDAAGTPIG